MYILRQVKKVLLQSYAKNIWVISVRNFYSLPDRLTDQKHHTTKITVVATLFPAVWSWTEIRQMTSRDIPWSTMCFLDTEDIMAMCIFQKLIIFEFIDVKIVDFDIGTLYVPSPYFQR